MKVSGIAYLEEILDGVGVIVVCESERGSFERRDTRRDVASQCELVDVIVVEHRCHAWRYDHDDSIARCTHTSHHK